MEVIYFTITAIFMYFAADRILDFMERKAGRRFENRSIFFFGILVFLAVAGFWLIRTIADG